MSDDLDNDGFAEKIQGRTRWHQLGRLRPISASAAPRPSRRRRPRAVACAVVVEGSDAAPVADRMPLPAVGDRIAWGAAKRTTRGGATTVVPRPRGVVVAVTPGRRPGEDDQGGAIARVIVRPE